MERKRLLGLIGPVILIGGVFSPALHVPELGNINYFVCGKGDGTILIMLALISSLFVLKKNYNVLWYTGLGSLSVIVFTFMNIQKELAELSSPVAHTYHLSWGWIVLIVGAGSVIAAAALKENAVELANAY